MDGGGGSGTGEEKGETRVTDGGNVRQNLPNEESKSEGGGISGAVIDAPIGIFFVSPHC